MLYSFALRPHSKAEFPTKPQPILLKTCFLNRAVWAEKARLAIAEEVPKELHEALGIGAMGLDLAAGWSSADQEAFGAAMRQNDAHKAAQRRRGREVCGRGLDVARAEFLPGKTMAEVVNFYYGVWKTGLTPAAREYRLSKRKVGLVNCS